MLFRSGKNENADDHRHGQHSFGPSGSLASSWLDIVSAASINMGPLVAPGAPPPILASIVPGKSGMACQWDRAQAGDVNPRILANGPAAFKVTGTEAEVFGDMFRQFFLVA